MSAFGPSKLGRFVSRHRGRQAGDGDAISRTSSTAGRKTVIEPDSVKLLNHFSTLFDAACASLGHRFLLSVFVPPADRKRPLPNDSLQSINSIRPSQGNAAHKPVAAAPARARASLHGTRRGAARRASLRHCDGRSPSSQRFTGLRGVSRPIAQLRQTRIGFRVQDGGDLVGASAEGPRREGPD